MKNRIAILLMAAVLGSCNNQKKTETEQATPADASKQTAALYGASFEPAQPLDKKEIGEVYQQLTTQDTVEVIFKSAITDVCQAKGCWMKVPVGQDTAMVRFKDYGFFVPLNSSGKEVTLKGKAFIAEVPVDELKHLAEDGGKSAAYIASIIQPRKILSFEATGVLIED
ncbi:DUF4920 domain-containing protein [Croceiramulus getboli]|nr:DUF4920 domain-containing protein [Flavobacteriaceae bacterium YJPT1-3]